LAWVRISALPPFIVRWSPTSKRNQDERKQVSTVYLQIQIDTKSYKSKTRVFIEERRLRRQRRLGVFPARILAADFRSPVVVVAVVTTEHLVIWGGILSCSL